MPNKITKTSVLDIFMTHCDKLMVHSYSMEQNTCNTIFEEEV